MQKYISRSENETKQIAEALAKRVRQAVRPRAQGRVAHHKSSIFALTGELGAGKTIFAQGFAKGLGITDKIISPTFVLIRQHQIPSTKNVLYHVDLYRLEDTRTLKELGLEELWSNHLNIVLIEWAEKIEASLPKETTWIMFKKTDNQNLRKIFIKNLF